MLGIGSVLSFNAWASWHPFSGITRLRSMTFFDALDFISSNLLLPVGALFTCALIGWRLPQSFGGTELAEETATVRRLVLLLLRYVCPVAIASVLVAAFA